MTSLLNQPLSLTAMLLLLSVGTAQADSYTDNFDNGIIDPYYWTVQITDNSVLSPINGRLEMTQGTGPVIGGGVNLAFNFTITGDFTADIDFTLLNWPSNNIERVGISANPTTVTPLGVVARVSDANYPYPEFYGSFFSGTSGPPYHQNFISSTDLSGRLRLERTGPTMAGYYWNGGNWTLVGAYSDASQLVPINGLSFGIWDYLSDTPGVKVAMDNFVLNAPGTSIPPIPEPKLWATFLFGLGLIGLRLRSRSHSERTRRFIV